MRTFDGSFEDESSRKIYIVDSYTDTWPGKLIVFRAKLKFWNRYDGDIYSHTSISLEQELTRMFSFARRGMHNPFNAGLIQESIKTGLFSRKPRVSRMAVFELPLSEEQHECLEKQMKADWAKRDMLKYNFGGIMAQLLFARGVAQKDRYFCSQWVASLLGGCGVDLFHKNPVHVRPFDFYTALKDNLIYEGLVKDYSPVQDISETGAH